MKGLRAALQGTEAAPHLQHPGGGRSWILCIIILPCTRHCPCARQNRLPRYLWKLFLDYSRPHFSVLLHSNLTSRRRAFSMSLSHSKCSPYYISIFEVSRMQTVEKGAPALEAVGEGNRWSVCSVSVQTYSRPSLHGQLLVPSRLVSRASDLKLMKLHLDHALPHCYDAWPSFRCSLTSIESMELLL